MDACRVGELRSGTLRGPTSGRLATNRRLSLLVEAAPGRHSVGMRHPLRKCLPGALALALMLPAGCAQNAPSSASGATPSTSASFALSLPAPPADVVAPPEAMQGEEPIPADFLAPLVLLDAPAPILSEAATTRDGSVYAPPPARPAPIDHVCPSGTAPYAEVTESRAEPAPGYGERPESYGHRYLVTAAGRIYNGTTGDVSLDVSRPITVTVDGRGTRLDDVRVARHVPARTSHSWTASGYYIHYGDASYWRPRLSAVVDRWTWADHRDRDCPR